MGEKLRKLSHIIKKLEELETACRKLRSEGDKKRWRKSYQTVDFVEQLIEKIDEIDLILPYEQCRWAIKIADIRSYLYRGSASSIRELITDFKRAKTAVELESEPESETDGLRPPRFGELKEAITEISKQHPDADLDQMKYYLEKRYRLKTSKDSIKSNQSWKTHCLEKRKRISSD